MAWKWSTNSRKQFDWAHHKIVFVELPRIISLEYYTYSTSENDLWYLEKGITKSEVTLDRVETNRDQWLAYVITKTSIELKIFVIME